MFHVRVVCLLNQPLPDAADFDPSASSPILYLGVMMVLEQKSGVVVRGVCVYVFAR